MDTRAQQRHQGGSARPRFKAQKGRKAKATVLSFWLSRPGLVVLQVTTNGPACLGLGAVQVHGHAGLNRVVFKGRVGGEALSRGVYYLRAAVVRRHERRGLGRVSVTVAANGRVTPTADHSRLQPCRLLAVAREVTGVLASGTVGLSTRGDKPATGARSGVKGAIATIVGTPLITAAHEASLSPWFSPVLIAGLILSALLLGAAATQRQLAFIHPALVQRRSELASVGATLLLAILIALLLTRI